MNSAPGFARVDTASQEHSEALLRAHRREEDRSLRMRLIAMWWDANPDASHPEFEAFLRLLDAERRPNP